MAYSCWLRTKYIKAFELSCTINKAGLAGKLWHAAQKIKIKKHSFVETSKEYILFFIVIITLGIGHAGCMLRLHS